MVSLSDHFLLAYVILDFLGCSGKGTNGKGVFRGGFIITTLEINGQAIILVLCIIPKTVILHLLGGIFFSLVHGHFLITIKTCMWFSFMDNIYFLNKISWKTVLGLPHDPWIVNVVNCWPWWQIIIIRKPIALNSWPSSPSSSLLCLPTKISLDTI